MRNTWSAKEARLIYERQPYMGQWWEETKGFQVVEPGKTVGGKVATSTVNGVGKALVGVSTILDRGIDALTNPKPPEALREGDILPRTQRDVRQLFKGIFSKDAIDHPIGTVVASGMRILNATTSLATDGIQKLGGGHNKTSYNTAA